MQDDALPMPLRLERRGDEVWARCAPGEPPARVRLCRLRPLQAPDGAFSVIAENRHELALVERLEDLEPASREVARTALDEDEFIPRIVRVRDTAIRSGTRTWEVDTDRGPRRFLMKDPHLNLLWLTPDQLLLRDTDGNRYAIDSMAALSPACRRKVGRML